MIWLNGWGMVMDKVGEWNVATEHSDGENGMMRPRYGDRAWA